jgi:transposase
MKRVREALRLYEKCGLSLRKTAQALSVSRPVLTDYLTRCREHEISYDKACELTDAQLSSVFQTDITQKNTHYQTLLGLFPEYARELSRLGVTRQFLWEEYRNDHNGTYSYSQFCYHFQQWNDKQEVSMVIEHKAGDKLYVDYTGKKLQLVDYKTGEITPVEIFVATLGASKLIYAEAVRSQKKQDFIQAQVNTLEYIGGVPQAIVPDCLKSAVSKGHRYEPDINPEYQKFAEHYETTILAARPYKPKDKAVVEGAVKIVYQCIFAPLRDRVFHTIDELNVAIREELEKLNNRVMQQYKKSRWEMFHDIEKEYLSPLPVETYQYQEYRRLKVQCNYHVYLSTDKHYYSVPYSYLGKHVELFYTPTSVEIFHNNQRIALHRRNQHTYGYTTVHEHLPPQHRYKDNWNSEKLLSWGESIGRHVRDVVDTILSRKTHPEQGFKSCMGILNLTKKYDHTRLDKACQKALMYEYVSYKGIENMLKNGVEENMQQELFKEYTHGIHENVRGQKYYKQEQIQ